MTASLISRDSLLTPSLPPTSQGSMKSLNSLFANTLTDIHKAPWGLFALTQYCRASVPFIHHQSMLLLPLHTVGSKIIARISKICCPRLATSGPQYDQRVFATISCHFTRRVQKLTSWDLIAAYVYLPQPQSQSSQLLTTGDVSTCICNKSTRNPYAPRKRL